MHNSLPNIYCFINDLDQRYIKNLEKKIGIIYRNYDNKINSKDIINFGKLCKKNRRKFYIANEFKLAISANLDGVYIPSFNKSLSINYYNKKKNFLILGSAHNIKELSLKNLQGCKTVLFSRLFQTEYKEKNGHLGIIKFNLLARTRKENLIPLGGIRISNLNKMKLLASEGLVLLSEIKKKPAKIISRLF